MTYCKQRDALNPFKWGQGQRNSRKFSTTLETRATRKVAL